MIEIGSEHREPALTRIRFQSSVDHGANELILANHEPDRPSAPQHRHADQKPIALRHLVLLLLLKQHFIYLFIFNFNGKKRRNENPRKREETKILDKNEFREGGTKKQGIHGSTPRQR